MSMYRTVGVSLKEVVPLVNPATPIYISMYRTVGVSLKAVVPLVNPATPIYIYVQDCGCKLEGGGTPGKPCYPYRTLFLCRSCKEKRECESE